MEHQPRKFKSDAEITFIGEGLLDKSLPKIFWTHEAHFAAVVYFLTRRPEMDLKVQLPKIIFEYNEGTGGSNTDTSGYHETLTQFYIKVVSSFILGIKGEVTLTELCNRLVTSTTASRDYPLKFYSKDVLFSVRARKEWVDPDLEEF